MNATGELIETVLHPTKGFQSLRLRP